MNDSAVGDQTTPKAPKDKNCPYCGQAFTSSSLGRHLDLYIKDKNPKPPDGIHDVDEIRKTRKNITRRQPRGLHISKIDISTGLPLATLGAQSRRSPASDAGSGTGTPSTQHEQRDDHSATKATAGLAAFQPRWQVTGVMNDIPATPKETESPAQDASRRAIPPQRQVSRQVAKAQFDMKQRVQDALDTARASELALREVLGSWRAAKSLFDLKSSPFEFDPLTMDFPALVLQCLQAPPTLFSQTQLPSHSSWSVTPPGLRQFEALKVFFAEAHKKWRISCASVTTAVFEDMTYPPTQNSHPIDIPDMVRMAEMTAQTSEKQITEHLDSAFGVWDALPAQRQHELWVVELARSVGKRQTQMQKLQEEKQTLRQENAHLKLQIEQLNRLQQPKEFKILTPSTIPMSDNFVKFLEERGTVHGHSITALNRNDRHSELGTIVQSALDRWKHVITSARTASGMNAQRPLDQAQSPHPSSAPAAPGGGMTPGTPSAPPAPARPSVPILQHPPQPRHQAAPTPPQSQPYAPPMTENTGMAIAASAAATAHSLTTPATTAPDAWTPSAPTSSMASMDDDDMSDPDADAEMEDDPDYSFHTPHTAAPAAFIKQPPSTPLIKQQPPPTPLIKQQPPPTPAPQATQLQVPRTRPGGRQQQQPQQQQAQLGMAGRRSMTQAMGGLTPSPGDMGMNRLVAEMNPGAPRQARNFTAHPQAQAQHQQAQQQHYHEYQHQHQHQHQQQNNWNTGPSSLPGDAMHME